MKRWLFLFLLFPLFALAQTPVSPSGPKQTQIYLEPSTGRLWGYSNAWYVWPDSSKVVQWAGNGLPSQTGQSGKYLTTNGTTASWGASSGSVTSVTGTANRITSTGGATPVIDISGSYVGQASITTVGTLSAGSIPYSLLTGTPAIPVGANPTATAGASFVNGVATTFMRSDAAPKVDSTIFQTILNFFPKGDTRWAKISTLPTGANPTASLGLTAINGSSANFMRSDASPALSQAISPTWTNPHIFSNGFSSTLSNGTLFVPSATIGVSQTVPRYLFNGATTVFMQSGFGGSAGTTLTANSSYANTVFGSTPVTTAATGTHGMIANVVINPLGTVTNSGSTPLINTNLYVAAPISAGVADYSAIFGGVVGMQNNLTVSGNTVLQATTTNGLVTINSGLATTFTANGQVINVVSGTINDIFSTSGTIPLAPVSSIGVDTYTANSSGVIITKAPTLYISGAPLAGTNVTITNPYALYVNSGNVNIQSLTASQLVSTDANKNLTSTPASSASSANSVVQRDANSNTTINNTIAGYQTIVTAAGTTTLTVSSPQDTYFTGSTTQTVVLPVASTLILGQQFIIVNNSTGTVTVQSSGANAIQTQQGGTTTTYTCILTSGTTAASWSPSLQVSTTTAVNAIARMNGSGDITAAGFTDANGHGFNGSLFSSNGVAARGYLLATSASVWGQVASNGAHTWGLGWAATQFGTYAYDLTWNDSGGLLMPTAPTTSASTFDILTRNTSTGAIEKITSSSVPFTQGSADLTAQTTAGNVATFTVGSSTATFNISSYINVTAVSVDVIQGQITYTDENNTAQTISLASLSAIGNSTYSPITIRAKNATLITVKTNLTTGAGSITYDTGARITQL